jgi:hypothetical protein
MVTKIAEFEGEAEKERVQAEDSDDGDEEVVEITGLKFLDAGKGVGLIMNTL